MSRKLKIILICMFIACVVLLITHLLSVTLVEVRDDLNSESSVYEVEESSAYAGEIKRVLFLSAYAPSFDTFEYQLDGIKSVLGNGYAEIDVEFMDTKRFYTDDNFDNFYNSIKYKIDTLPKYDAIIAADDNALAFTIEYQEELFKDIPIVFLGINNYKFAMNADKYPNITGIVEAVSIKETIEIAQNINPNAKRVVALVDSTPTGQGDLKSFYKAEDRIEGLEYADIDLTGLTFDEFQEELKLLGENDIILLLAVYRDKEGDSVIFDEGLRIVLENTSAPIYHIYYHGFGRGVLGGKIVSHFDQGSSAATIVKRVLEGENIDEIPCVTESPNMIIFDNNMLEEYSISKDDLPSDAIIINDDNIFRELVAILIYGIALIVFLFAIIVALGINISRRSKAETEYSKFKLLSDKAINGHMITDVDDIIVYCNEYYAAIHGYQASELTGQHRKILFSDKKWEKGRMLKEELAENNILKLTETEHTKKNGETFPLYTTGVIFYDEKEKKQYLAYNAIDASEIKLLEEKSTALEAALGEQQRLKAIGTLASGVAHEINNPINGIMNYAQIIEDIFPDGEDVNKYAVEIGKEANRVSRIVKNLLNYARQDKREDDYGYVNMKDVIEDTLSLIRTLLKKDSITLRVDIEKSLPPVNCVSQEIQQIIMNLTTNAKDSVNKKYTEFSDDKVINITCRKININGRECIRTTVEDFGTGIDEEVGRYIFDPFFTTKGREEGTGLGLSISHRLAAENGGRLSFDSVKNEYTKFYLDLPIDVKCE